MSFFYKLKANNVTPMTRTPWAGDLIRKIKKSSFSRELYDFSHPIGESWEVSSDKAFESIIVESSLGDYKDVTLNTLIEREGLNFLGQKLCNTFGDKHYPLLLKWLHASSSLSVQVHPDDHSPLLGKNDCGKPESWLVVESKKNSHIYLGFKAPVTKKNIKEALIENTIEELLYKYHPKPFDYIIVPEGCVHSIGPDVFVMEPQKILDGKSGKTYRFYDWGRTYNEQGKIDPFGAPRTLHIEKSLEAIDLSLPFGESIKDKFIFNLKNKKKFSGSDFSPFEVEVFSEKGVYSLKLPKEQACALSLVYGKIHIESQDKESMSAQSGESLLISAQKNTEVKLVLDSCNDKEPFAAVFYFNLG